MRAVVMAGGQGARLRPLTSNQPKPMLPIVGQPMMQDILRLARRHGFTEVVATVPFLASIVRNFFGDGSDLELSLLHATEEKPLGTAGSVKNAGPLLDDRFLVLSGDSLTDVDLTEVAIPWEAKVTVMRRLLEHLNDGPVLTIDGIKVYRDRDWALIVSHPQEPMVRVRAEAGTAEAAGAMAEEFASLVEGMKA